MTAARDGIQGVVYVADLASMETFYAEVCGLGIVEQVAGQFTTLESTAVALSLVRVPEEIAAAYPVSSPPVRREAVAVKMSFPVESIAGARDAALATGGWLDGVETEWEFRGFRVCGGYDPEGNILSVREPLR